MQLVLWINTNKINTNNNLHQSQRDLTKGSFVENTGCNKSLECDVEAKNPIISGLSIGFVFEIGSAEIVCLVVKVKWVFRNSDFLLA